MNLPHFPKLIARRRQENRALHVLMTVLLLDQVFLQMPLPSPLPGQIYLNHSEAKHMLDASVSAFQLILPISIFFCLSAPHFPCHIFPLKCIS